MKNLIIMFSVLFIFASCGELTKITNENSEKVSAQSVEINKRDNNCEIMDFRFLIEKDYQASPVIHRVDVFLDKRAFSEANLKKLFSKISNKYADATFLIVIVKTDWEQISMPTYPEDCPGSGFSEQDSPPQMFKYQEAKYYRRGENEFFTYNKPILGKSEHIDVILKGGKIYRNGTWQEP